MLMDKKQLWGLMKVASKVVLWGGLAYLGSGAAGAKAMLAANAVKEGLDAVNRKED